MKKVEERFVCSASICYEGGGGKICLFYIYLLPMCQKWWWSVVNMKEVEERFVCSTSICYLLVCARVVEKCGQYEGDGGKVVFSISTILSLSPSVYRKRWWSVVNI